MCASDDLAVMVERGSDIDSFLLLFLGVWLEDDEVDDDDDDEDEDDEELPLTLASDSMFDMIVSFPEDSSRLRSERERCLVAPLRLFPGTSAGPPEPFAAVFSPSFGSMSR